MTAHAKGLRPELGKEIEALGDASKTAGEPRAKSKNGDTNVNPFRDCGIGAQIFPDDGQLAAVANLGWSLTVDLGTTMVSSATLSPQTCAGAKADMARFINGSYENLELETARGEGQHLATLTGIMGCSEGARGEAVAALRNNLKTVTAQAGFAQASRQDKVKLYYGSAVQAASRTSGCTLG